VGVDVLSMSALLDVLQLDDGMGSALGFGSREIRQAWTRTKPPPDWRYCCFALAAVPSPPFGNPKQRSFFWPAKNSVAVRKVEASLPDRKLF
jgi:hypothetical protein